MIKYENVSFAYNNEPIFDNVNVSIARGEYVLVIGPNGAGKSTFIKCLLGLVTAQQGMIYLNETPIKQFKDWEKISYVAQRATHLQVALPISVAELVGLGTIKKVTKNEIVQALELVGMQAFIHHDIHKLSGGQQQRVFIARALMSNPDLIVLDEPTVGLDAATVQSFYELVAKLHKMGKTIIMVTHDMHVLSADATRVIAINKKIEFDGTLHDYSHWHEQLCLYCGTTHQDEQYQTKGGN